MTLKVISSRVSAETNTAVLLFILKKYNDHFTYFLTTHEFIVLFSPFQSTALLEGMWSKFSISLQSQSVLKEFTIAVFFPSRITGCAAHIDLIVVAAATVELPNHRENKFNRGC